MNAVRKIQKVTAKAVISGEAHTILLVQERDGRWEFPGGKIEFGETPQEALQRESKKELGLTDGLEIGNIINSWTWVFEFERVHIQFFMLAYACKTSQREFTLGKEHVEHGWFQKEEALKLNLTEGTRMTFEML